MYKNFQNKMKRSMKLWTILVLLCGGCSSNFVAIEPESGQVCDVVTIVNDEGHRCGTYSVTFGGVLASDAHVLPLPSDDVSVTVPEGARSGAVLITQHAGTCALIGAFGSRNVNVGDFTVTGTPGRPVIRSFGADRLEIAEGESVTLSWLVDGPTSDLTLSFGGTSSPVSSPGSRVVSPRSATTYVLNAENRCLTDSESLNICVNESQEAPLITNADEVFPGTSITITGRHFTYESCRGDAESSLVFSQGGSTTSPVVDASPSSSRLNGVLPSSLIPGPAQVTVRVGSMTSTPFDFTVKGRTNGSFAAPSLIQSGSTSCTHDGTNRSLLVTNAGATHTAVFREGSRTIWTDTFELALTRSGAALSPDCTSGVIVSKNTTPGADDDHVLQVRNFETGVRHSDPSLGQDIQLLFSPDETVIVYKAEDNFRGAGHSSFSIHDMQRDRSISGPGSGVTCVACFSLSASVSGFRNVFINYAEHALGPYRIE